MVVFALRVESFLMLSSSHIQHSCRLFGVVDDINAMSVGIVVFHDSLVVANVVYYRFCGQNGGFDRHSPRLHRRQGIFRY